MSSSSYAHMNHNMNAMAQGMVNCNPMGNVAATNMHPMAAASMNGVNNSMSPQMMNPQWAQNPNSIEFQSGGYSNQLGQNYPMLHSQQNSSQNGMLGSPNSNNLTAQKKNILKRKNMMQPQPNQQFIMDQQQPPNKQPFMTSNHPEMIQNHYIQQNPSSMYQMGQQQNGAVQGSSPQFSSASPMNNHNHLSPYGGYDSANGVQPQWNKRPPSRGDIVRMELRHSVQARRATSPHPPNGMISANDLGMPRFPAPTNAISPSNMMLSPQRISQPSQDAQQTQQQQQQQQHSNQALRADPVYSGQILNAIPQNFPSESQKNFHLQQDMNNPMTQLSQFSSSTINTLPPISLEDCRAILECDFNDLCNDLGPPDFNLCNGQFDMDYDETRNLVQRILG
uniref:Uncharacterized protein n=1 Tax=Acrobeloides nanus TaxID=290746 RepID=A0A914DUF2_9BILA